MSSWKMFNLHGENIHARASELATGQGHTLRAWYEVSGVSSSSCTKCGALLVVKTNENAQFFNAVGSCITEVCK